MKIAFNKKILVAFVTLLLAQGFSYNGSAQTPAGSGFTVQQAIEYALKNETNVKNAQIETQIAQAKINELIGVGLPQVKGTADINKFIEIPTSLCRVNFLAVNPEPMHPFSLGRIILRQPD